MCAKKSSSSSSSSSKTIAFVSDSIHHCHLVASFIALYWSSFLFSNTCIMYSSIMPPEIKECQKVNLLKNVKLFLRFSHTPAFLAFHSQFTRYILRACVLNQPMGHQFYSVPFITPTIFSPFFCAVCWWYLNGRDIHHPPNERRYLFCTLSAVSNIREQAVER